MSPALMTEQAFSHLAHKARENATFLLEVMFSLSSIYYSNITRYSLQMCEYEYMCSQALLHKYFYFKTLEKQIHI